MVTLTESLQNECKCGHPKESHVYIIEAKGFIKNERFAGCHVLIGEWGGQGTMAYHNCENLCKGFEPK